MICDPCGTLPTRCTDTSRQADFLRTSQHWQGWESLSESQQGFQSGFGGWRPLLDYALRLAPLDPRLNHFVHFPGISRADWISLGKITQRPKPCAAALLKIKKQKLDDRALVLLRHSQNGLIARMCHPLGWRREVLSLLRPFVRLLAESFL